MAASVGLLVIIQLMSARIAPVKASQSANTIFFSPYLNDNANIPAHARTVNPITHAPGPAPDVICPKKLIAVMRVQTRYVNR